MKKCKAINSHPVFHVVLRGNYFGHICVDTCSGVKVEMRKRENLLEHLLLPTLIIIVVIL